MSSAFAVVLMLAFDAAILIAALIGSLMLSIDAISERDEETG